MGKKDVMSKVATIDIEKENDLPQEISQINQFDRLSLLETSINILLNRLIAEIKIIQKMLKRLIIRIDREIRRIETLLNIVDFIRYSIESSKYDFKKIKEKREKKIQKKNQRLLKKKIKNTAKLYNYGKKAKKNNKWR